MPIPSALSHYQILGPIGKGGMGEVFLAEDTRLHRKVAIKILSELTAADPERRQRFEREAQVVAALNHPNIVTIHAVEEANGIPFIVMELVEGQTLSELLKGGGLPLDTLLRIGAAVSDAIGAAHQRGITHRDLKPVNVMVTGEGRVKVLDFGLAKLREVEAAYDGETRLPAGDLTGEGRIMGTVAYMSPEQAEGKAVDPRSDIFSLGVMLHEMATGERPFKGDTNVSIISSILKDTPDSVSDVNPALPTGLARIIRRALSKDPSRRFQTAIDLRNELDELKQDLDSGVTISSPSVAAARTRGVSKPVLFGGLGLIALLIVAVGVHALRSRAGSATPELFEVGRITRLTSSGSAQQAVISADGRYVVHVKNDGGRPSIWMRQTATTSDVQIVPPVDGRYAGLSFSPDGNYIFYGVYPPQGGAVATLYKLPVLGGTPQRILDDIDSAATFAPDGRIAFMRGVPDEGRVYVMVANADGSDIRRLATVQPPDFFIRTSASWSPDGATILAIGQSLRDGPYSEIFAVDVASGTAKSVGGKWGQVTDVKWLPGGRSFLVAGADFAPGGFQIQLFEVPYPGQEHRRITVDLNTYVTVSASGDGRTIAAVQVETQSAVWATTAADPSGGHKVVEGRATGVGQSSVGWMPDGRVVYSSAVSGSPQIWISNSDGRKARQVTNAGYAANFPDVAADGAWIVFQAITASGIGIARIAADGSQLTTLVPGPAFNPKISPDGRWVYYNNPTSGSPRAFRVPTGGGTPESLGSAYFSPMDVSADGTRLLGIGWDAKQSRTVFTVMTVADRSLRELDLPVLGGATFGPDGTSIVYLASVAGERPSLWQRPLDGGTPRRLTDIDETILNWAWSPDGTQLLLVRATTSSDVVLIARK